MELKAFRVENFKKIRDTGWIDCDRLMVFVGKNESGKSALFRGLSKLKPTDGTKYDPIKEFPHGRYTDEFKKQDWPVASGRYELSKDDKIQLLGMCEFLRNANIVTITRHYSDKQTVSFNPMAENPFSNNQWTDTIALIKKECNDSIAPNGQGDTWSSHKSSLVSFLSTQLEQSKSPSFNLTSAIVEETRKNITSHMNEQWMKDILQPILNRIDEVLHLVQQSEGLVLAQKWVCERMPYFLYFGNYEVLSSAIYLPDLIRRITQNDLTPKTRVQSALFKHVGVDIQELVNLGKHNPGQTPEENANIRKQIDELDIKANAASIAMTNKFTAWWEQRKHKFTYKFHGDYFRVWISDDLDPADVELEERSLGLQYFFSFYLLFLVEAEEKHRDCILLLDEPGIHLHGTAQNKLIHFLEKVSEKNQTFYSTHSPFMIDGNHLERARAVFETQDGTMVSSDVWPRDRDTLFPLQAALGYSVCQSLFIASKQLVVEGLTDYMLLCVLNQQLKKDGKGLNGDIIMIPMGGTTNLAPLASMLIGHDIQIGILLDSDPAGIGSMKKIRGLLTDVDHRCVLVSKIADQPNVNELEDLIPEDYYLDATSRSYPSIKLTFNEDEKKIANIVDRITAFFDRNQYSRFEKWRPIQTIIQDINIDDKRVPKELFIIAAKIFNKFNRIMNPTE